MVTLLIIITVYLLSFLSAYKLTKYMYFNEKGIWYGLTPEFSDKFFIVCPVFNTMLVLIYSLLGIKN